MAGAAFNFRLLLACGINSNSLHVLLIVLYNPYCFPIRMDFLPPPADHGSTCPADKPLTLPDVHYTLLLPAGACTTVASSPVILREVSPSSSSHYNDTSMKPPGTSLPSYTSLHFPPTPSTTSIPPSMDMCIPVSEYLLQVVSH